MLFKFYFWRIYNTNFRKIGSDYLQISDSEYFDKSYVPTNF